MPIGKAPAAERGIACAERVQDATSCAKAAVACGTGDPRIDLRGAELFDGVWCEAAGAVARADDESCPASAGEAADNASWAAARWESIRERPPTVGLFYDEDGTQHEYVSGKDGAERTAEVLAEVGAAASPIGTCPAATHVEVKAPPRTSPRPHGCTCIPTRLHSAPRTSCPTCGSSWIRGSPPRSS